MKIVRPLRFNPFTFSRNSEARYLAASGDIETAAIDELRIGYTYDADTDSLLFSGSITESSAINYLANSNNFSQWTTAGFPLPTITDNAAVSPSGDTDASLFERNSSSGSQSITSSTYWNAGSGPAVFSVFLKAAQPNTAVRLTFYTETAVFRINVGDYSALGSQSKITPYPDGWFRCEVYMPSAFTTNVTIQSVGSSDDDFYLWHAQVEPTTLDNSYAASSPIVGSGSSVVDVSGASVSRVSGTLFTEYAEGQQIYIALSPTGNTFTIDNISDGDSMTLLTSTGVTQTSKNLWPRWKREADVVVDQTPSLISSNIVEDDADIWDSGDSYTVGEKVMVLGEYHRVYEALTDHTNKFPPDNVDTETPDWLDTGATNRWRMFDMEVGPDLQSYATVSDGSIDVLMGAESTVSSVILLNIEGDTARVTMRNPVDGSVLYERDIELLGTPMDIGWWNFFFDYRQAISKVVLTDLPRISPATIQVEIFGAACRLGKLIIGDDINIGCTQFGTSVGITDFSRKERDAFGNNYILERRYIDKADYPVQMTSDKVDATHALLSQLRATPAVYIGSENYISTVVYGYYKDFSIVISNSRYSQCSLSVEGI